MALFKISKGNKATLPSAMNEGWAYVTADEHKMYIDTSDSARIELNADLSDRVYYGTCSTAAGTSEKVVIVQNAPTDSSNNAILPTVKCGTMLVVYFTYTNTDSNPTLNFAGTTAPIRLNGDNLPGSTTYDSWPAGTTVTFIYDNNNKWRIMAIARRTFDSIGIDESTSTITATNFSGLASSASKLTTDAGTSEIPVYFSDGIPVACVGDDVFSQLQWNTGVANGPTLDITVAGKNRTAAIPVATNLVSGVVAVGDQTFAGIKTFTTDIKTGGNIKLYNSQETDRYIIFDYDNDATAGASWRIASLNSGNGDSNYFVIQTGGSDTTAVTWNNAVCIGMNTYDVTVGGNINPTTSASKSLGTSSLKWQHAYIQQVHTDNTVAAVTAINAGSLPSLTYSYNSTTECMTVSWSAGSLPSVSVTDSAVKAM